MRGGGSVGNGAAGGGRGWVGVLSGAAVVEGGSGGRWTCEHRRGACARPGAWLAWLCDEAWGWGGTRGARCDACGGEGVREFSRVRYFGNGDGARARGPSAALVSLRDRDAHARTLTGALAHGAKRLSVVDTLDAYAFSPASLPLTLNSAPHLFGDAKALTAATLVPCTRIRSGKRLVADSTWRGLSAVTCGLVEMAREVPRGAELKVAILALVLGLGTRVLHDHPARLSW